MKCIPMTLSGRLVRAAISVMEMLLVLLARMVSGPQIESSASKIPNLTAGASLAASITTSASLAPSSVVTGRMRRAIASALPSGSVPFFSWRATLARMVASAFSSIGAAVSTSVTDHSC